MLLHIDYLDWENWGLEVMERRGQKEAFPKRSSGLEETTGDWKEDEDVPNWRKVLGSGRRF